MKISKDIIELIKNGAVGVMPTDTIYGIVASAFCSDSFDRIYQVKNRPENKQMVHLIGDVKQLNGLGIHLNKAQIKSLNSVWPGPVSVVFDCDDSLPKSHCGTFTIAVRLPEQKWLKDFVLQTGPIVATSANISGSQVKQNISDIKRELADLDFYLEGETGKVPSKIVKMHKDGQIEYLAR